MKIIINISEAKKQLSMLTRIASEGEEVIITKRGIPAVRLISCETPKRGIWELLGCMKGEISYKKDWDAPLQGTELSSFYGDDTGR